MGAGRRRYTSKEFPDLAGDTVVVTFRLNRQVADLLTQRLEAKPEGIANRTDAMQDATVVWLMLEEHAAAE